MRLIASLLPILTMGVAASADDAPSCGTSCLAPPQRNYFLLQSCLSDAFPPDAVGAQEGLGFFGLPKVTYPGVEAYPRARRTQFGNMRPAVVVMAENEDDVVKAVKCSVEAGYRISPRGRGHHFQGLSNMDGYVVIDCSLLCNPDDFVYDMEGGDWLLPGQKYLGAVTGGAGCTNAVMLSAIHKRFEPSDGALYAIGTCPSVGITGYTTGGGAGEITPYVGWGADDILEATIVLWDGSVVTANSTHNADLFWATQGGGSGLGIIVSLKTVITQAPGPPSSSDARKYTWTIVDYKTSTEEDRRAFLTAFSQYLYDADPLTSSKYGGGGFQKKESKQLKGLFLGSAEEFLANFRDNGLLDDNLLDDSINSQIMLNYEELCDGSAPCSADTTFDFPSVGVEVAEFNTYGEAMLYKLCTSIASWDKWRNAGANSMTQSSGDWCADLGISSEYCNPLYPHQTMTMDECMAFGTPEAVCADLLENGITQEECDLIGMTPEVCAYFLSPFYSEPLCKEPEVLAAFVEAAYDPLSFINQQGPPEWFVGFTPTGDYDGIATSLGGLMIPKVDIDTFMDLDEMGISLNHFQHGAPMAKTSDSTAFPWRDAAIMIEFTPREDNNMADVLNRMAQFYGDDAGLQGYYNYMNPIGNPNWRYYYFGDNYDRLTQIKLKYDPLDFFGHPMQVERAAAGSVTPNGETSTSGPTKGSKVSAFVMFYVASILTILL